MRKKQTNLIFIPAVKPLVAGKLVIISIVNRHYAGVWT